MKHLLATMTLALLGAAATPAGLATEPGVKAAGPLSRIVLDYIATMKRLVVEAKQPGFNDDSWAPLTKMVAVKDFRRVGAFREVMTWREYANFLTKWAKVSTHDHTIRRITELPGRVYLELEERNGINGQVSVVNSLSVYEFDQTNKIRHLDIYLQRSADPGEVR
jgi:hypothetical protein